MAWTTTAHRRAWHYSNNVGRSGPMGMGFSSPVAVAVGNLEDEGSVAYVANRGSEYNRDARITMLNLPEERFICDFGLMPKDNSRLFTRLSGLVADRRGFLYATDEWLHMVFAFTPWGEHYDYWGEQGAEPGQLNGPAAVCRDSRDRLWIVNSGNSLVQQFTRGGVYLRGFGAPGRDPGQLDRPSGIACDADDCLYVSDWGNHRVQKFTPEGRLLDIFGTGPAGRLRHPMGLDVDGDGDLYVADMMNNRVVIYRNDTQPLAYLLGDATDISYWGWLQLEANPDMRAAARRRVPDLWRQQRTFRIPMGVKFDRATNRLLVCDTARDRIQVYWKDNDYKDVPFNL